MLHDSNAAKLHSLQLHNRDSVLFLCPACTGVTEPKRLMDKICHFCQSGTANQISLYSHSPDSVLYQEMLSYKASATNHTHSRDDSSDWEVLSGDNYDGDSEASSISYFSEDDDDLPTMTANSKIIDSTGQRQLEPQRNGVVGVANLHDDVEVGYCTPGRFRTLEVEEEGEKSVGKKGREAEKNEELLQQGVGMEEHNSGRPISPTINIVRQGRSSGSDQHSDEEGRLFLTPDDHDSWSSSSDVETKFRKRSSKTWSSDRMVVTPRSTATPHSSSNSMMADHTPDGPGMRRTAVSGSGGVASLALNPTAANSQ